MGTKRGQLTVFIIVGLLMLIGIGTVAYVSNKGPNVGAETVAEDPASQLQGIIVQCVRTQGVPLLQQISRLGGTLRPGLLYRNERYNAFCQDAGISGCVNAFITKEEIAAEYDAALLPLMHECLDFTSLKRKGFEITVGELVLSSTLTFDEVVTDVTLPITLTQGEDIIEFSKVVEHTQSPLGMLHSLALVLVNQQIEQGFIDKDTWMKTYGSTILIDIDRPYPNTLITLTTTDETLRPYTFHFNIPGLATFNSPLLSPRPPAPRLETCNIGRDCFDNVPAVLCPDKGGTVVDEGADVCSPPFVPSALCDGRPCGDCAAQGKAHGDQWCTSTTVRSDGLDPVGSRHVKESCIDGNVIVEPCRDYREELCTKEGAVAACRQNRWWDCWQQTSQSACEDPQRRDCFWDGDLVPSPRIEFLFPDKDNARCRPLVAPGLQHWLKSKQNALVCQLGNEQVREEIGVFSQAIHWKPPVVHANGMTQWCQSLGDCGNKMAVTGAMPKKSFTSTTGRPDKTLGITTGHATLSRPVKVPLFVGTPEDVFTYPEGVPEAMDERTREYVNWWLSLDPLAVLTDQIPLHIIHRMDCKVWKSPKKPTSCDECADSIGGCSEYLCRSLGKACIFTIDSVTGSPRCYVAGSQPALAIEMSSIQHPIVRSLQGWKVQTPLNPYETLDVKVTTDRPAVCRFTVVPGLPDYVESSDPAVDQDLQILEIAANMMAQNGYESFSTLGTRDAAREQELRVEVPDVEVLNFFEGSSTLALLANPAGVKGLLDTPSAQTVQNDPALADRLQPAKERAERWLESVEKGLKEDDRFNSPTNKANLLLTYTDLQPRDGVRTARLYLTCEDEAGYAGSQELLQVPIKKDELPPAILDVTTLAGPPQRLVVKLNEPAECSYAINVDASYAAMTAMECDISRVSKRQCESVLPPSTRTVFIKCRDRPFAFNRFNLTVARDGARVVKGVQAVSSPEQLIVTYAPFARIGTARIPFQQDSVQLNITSRFGQSICKYGLAGGFDALPNTMTCNDKNCLAPLDTSVARSYYFMCANPVSAYQNTNAESYRHDLS